MGNVFNISRLAGTITNDALEKAKVKAFDLAGQLGLNNAFSGHVLPPLPPYPITEESRVMQAEGYSVEPVEEQELHHVSNSIFGYPMCFPLKIKGESQNDNEWWLLPVEPMITIGGGNTVIRRNVAKGRQRGTIKERWSNDDYTISINGLFTKKDNWTYPRADVIKLRELLESRESLDLQCDLFEIFNIGSMVVEKFDFPFTKGEENQAWSITGYSDDDWQLFIDIDAR